MWTIRTELAVMLLLAARAMTLAGGTVAERASAEPLAKDATTVKGTIEGIDVKKNTVTIGIFSRADAETTNKSFTLAKDAKIQMDGAAVKLDDLKRGGHATLQLAEDKSVVSISVVGSTTRGEFFDAGKKTVTITVKTRDGTANRTFAVAKDAKVMVSGKAATLQDLKEGSTVILTFAAGADGYLVIRIQAAPTSDR